MDRRLALRELTLYSVLGVLLFAAKMAMAGLPNIEPVSLLVMLFAVCYGWRGLYPVYVYVLLEFAMWGVGLWSLCYLYVWLVLFALSRLLRRAESAWVWAALSGCFGLLFGALCALVYWAAGGWAAAVSWWVSGISMDIVHGVGNFVIALVLFRPLRRLLTTLNARYGVGELPASQRDDEDR